MLLAPVKSRILQILQLHHEFGNELLENSFHHIFYLTAIAAPVSAVHVLIFLNLSFDSANDQTWQTGITIYHAVLCLLACVLALITRPSRRATLSASIRWWLYRVCHIALVMAGIIVTSIDQLVTPSVTPFVLTCILAGVLFIVNPLTALVLYSALFISYALAVSLTQANDAILASNLVNGLTACSIAAGLSWLLWLQNIRSLQQRRTIQQQQGKLELTNRQLEQLATRDDLTGLANRRMLQMLVAEEQLLMKRQISAACLLLLDLDHFKSINDRYGHPGGDQILQQLAELLTQTVRASDRVARWGGEEFGILLRNTDAARALQVAELIRSVIEQHSYQLTDQSGQTHKVSITASIGLACLDASTADMLHQGYRDADVALYEAKASGRNRVVSSGVKSKTMA